MGAAPSLVCPPPSPGSLSNPVSTYPKSNLPCPLDLFSRGDNPELNPSTVSLALLALGFSGTLSDESEALEVSL